MGTADGQNRARESIERPKSSFAKVRGGYRKYQSPDISVMRNSEWRAPKSATGRRSKNRSVDIDDVIADPASISLNEAM